MVVAWKKYSYFNFASCERLSKTKTPYRLSEHETQWTEERGPLCHLWLKQLPQTTFSFPFILATLWGCLPAAVLPALLPWISKELYYHFPLQASLWDRSKHFSTSKCKRNKALLSLFNIHCQFALTPHHWQNWKRVFLLCHCHEIYRVEEIGL